MKYRYAYKTSDGVRHEDFIDAPSREKAFESLRSKGIRPIKVIATDGSKENGEIRGIRKRVFVASLVIVAIFVGVTAHFLTRKGGDIIRLLPRAEVVTCIPRHFIPHKEINKSHKNQFIFNSEKFLLHFCVPARRMDKDAFDFNIIASDLLEAINTPITKTENDSPIDIEIKGIVTSLKNEADLIIKSGRSPSEVLMYFVDRQKMEYEHRRRIVEQVQRGEMEKEAANSLFRSMGFEEL